MEPRNAGLKADATIGRYITNSEIVLAVLQRIGYSSRKTCNAWKQYLARESLAEE
jgi:hypothetical protein